MVILKILKKIFAKAVDIIVLMVYSVTTTQRCGMEEQEMDEVVFKVRNPYINEGIWDYNVYLKNEVEKHINEVMELVMFKANGGNGEVEG